MINETKQTAVEWLIEKLTNKQNGVFDGFPYLSVDEIYEQAKEMEKKQIEDAFEQGENNSVDYFNPKNRIKESEQYYIETYGGNK
jgi:hypothetical protein